MTHEYLAWLLRNEGVQLMPRVSHFTGCNSQLICFSLHPCLVQLLRFLPIFHPGTLIYGRLFFQSYLKITLSRSSPRDCEAYCEKDSVGKGWPQRSTAKRVCRTSLFTPTDTGSSSLTQRCRACQGFCIPWPGAGSDLDMHLT